MNRTRLNILIITSIALSILSGCTDVETIDINTGWRLSSSDSISFKDIELDDSDWDKINLPKLLTKDKKRQYFWLRKTVNIPEKFRGKDIAIFIGKIWDLDQTFFNGARIGSSGKEYPEFNSTWHFDRYYYIPSHLIKYGDNNVIAIRMFTNQNALFNGSPFIAELEYTRAYTFYMRFKTQYIAMGLGFLTFFIGLVALIQFLFDRSSRTPLFFAIISILWAVLSIHFYVPDLIVIDFNTHDKLYYALLCIEIVVIYFFMEKILRIKIKILEIISLFVLVIGVALSLSATAEDPITGWRFDVIGGIGILSQIFWGVLIFKGMKEKSIESKIILVSYAFFMICLIHDSLAISNIISYDNFWLNLAYPAVLLGFGIILTLRASLTSEQLIITTKEIESKNISLWEILNNVKESAEELTEFSRTLQATTTDLQSNMDEQGSNLEKTASAIDEVSASVESIANNAKEQDNTIKSNKELLFSYISSLDTVTEAARNAVNLSYTSQGQTAESRQKLMDIIKGMDKIKESSGAINEITEIINDIAEKTNLLSLNASIEAARAGEHGRGFAVVADEIGKLADSSIEQSKSIQSIVSKTVSDIESETELVNYSSKSIEEIEKSVNNVNSAIDIILDRCMEQEKLTKNIENNMKSILKGSSDISNSTSEERTTILEVSKSIEQLSSIMERVNQNSGQMMGLLDKFYRRIEILNEIMEKQD